MDTPFRIVTDEDLLQATLLNRVRLAPSGCWEWRGARDGRGYGMITRNNRTLRAHRVAFAAFKHEIPKGLSVLHSCDNPCCINPAHLSVGTHLENMRERDLRNRRDVKGEQIGTAKLTEQDVLAIKVSTLPGKTLAEIFGIDKSQVWNIRSGKSWRHLNEAAATLEENTHGR